MIYRGFDISLHKGTWVVAEEGKFIGDATTETGAMDLVDQIKRQRRNALARTEER